MTPSKLSLRTLRKLVTRRKGNIVREGSTLVYYKFGFGNKPERLELPESGCDANVTAAYLDRLISKYGAGYTGSTTNYRPKETDEVGSVSNQPSEDSTLHGGDGNSGECAHAAETSAQEGDARQAPEGTPTQPGVETAEQDSSNTEPSEGKPGTATTADGSARGSEEKDPQDTGETRHDDADEGRCDSAKQPVGVLDQTPTEKDTPDTVPDVTSDSDGTDPVENVLGDRTGGEGGDVTKPPAEMDLSDLTTEGPLKPKANYGGWCVDSRDVEQRATRLSRPAKKLAAVLRQWVCDIDMGGLDASPRLDGRRLVTELVSRRYSLQRARRVEADIPLIVLLADVSGSCSAVCSDTAAACEAVVKELTNAVFITHSNGLVGNSDISEIIATKYAGRKIGACVAFGDWDAGNHYRAICESGAKFAWLDSYCCSKGNVQKASRNLRAVAQDWLRQPDLWFQGVSGAEDAATAFIIAK